MTAANVITLGRLWISLAIFVVLAAFPTPGPLYGAFAMLLVAGVTDVLDGYVARRSNTITDFGRVADAFIDRVLIGGCFVIFLSWGLVDTWVVLVVIVREFLVGGMRNLADCRGKTFQATIFGKTKFATQYAACIAVILYRATGEPAGWPRLTMDAIVYLSALNTVVSGAVYLANYRKLVGNEQG